MVALAALVLSVSLLQARSWECPAGFAGPEQCLGKENAGKCNLQQPTNVEIDTSEALTCQNADAKLVEFESDLGLGAGSYYKGCGFNKAGLPNGCCNCWPLTQAVGSTPEESKGQCFACHNSCCKWWFACIFERCLWEGACANQQC